MGKIENSPKISKSKIEEPDIILADFTLLLLMACSASRQAKKQSYTKKQYMIQVLQKVTELAQ